MAVSKRDQAYEYIRKKIIFCEYKPGDVIDEKEIAASLGFSRTPVREAITHLAEEKLIRIFPRKGIIVNQVALKDLLDMIDARLLVEPYLISQAIAYVNHDDLAAFKACEERSLEQFHNTDQIVSDDFDYRFHLYFAQVVGNSYLENLMKQMLALSQRTRVFLPFSKERMLQSCHEHINIIDQIIAGNVEEAQNAVIAHLQRSKEGYLRVFQTHAEYFLPQ